MQNSSAYPIWHPYTPQSPDSQPILIQSARGVYLFSADGRKFIDAISSWWVNIHGHAHPKIAQAIARQAQELEQVIFADFTHPPAINLANKVLSLMPQRDSRFAKVFFSDNGSTAVEVALKIALQYWRQQPRGRAKILVFHHGYHGDTFGMMSASARSIFTQHFRDFLFEVDFIPAPQAELVLPQNPSEYACLLYEPLIQGAGGMQMQDAVKLEQLLSFCRQHGILLIADEVMTAWGRTGKLFASEYLETQPDIMCLSKGLTGGFLPLGLTLCTDQVYSAFREMPQTHNQPSSRTLFHGHSFCANPLACAAALSSIELLEQATCQAEIAQLSQLQHAFAQELLAIPLVHNPRSLGTIFACEIGDSTANYAAKIKHQMQQYLLKQGIYLRPLGNTLYLMPPYVITPKEMEHIYRSIKKMLKTLHLFGGYSYFLDSLT